MRKSRHTIVFSWTLPHSLGIHRDGQRELAAHHRDGGQLHELYGDVTGVVRLRVGRGGDSS